MNRLMIVSAALALWCGSARALPTWTTMSPGGGGNFTCADIQTNGRALIGSDNSGLYLSNGPGYYGSVWSRVGAVDGLLSSQIWSIAWSNKNPAWGWVATGNGLYKTIDNGSTWSRVLAGSGQFFNAAQDIHCVANSPVDSMTIYVGWREVNGTEEHISRSDDKGSTWSTIWNLSPADSSCILTIELKDSGDNEDVLVVTGRAIGQGQLQQLWVSEDRGTLNRYTKFNVSGTGDVLHPVLDATWTGGGDNILLSLGSDNDATGTEHSRGTVYVSDGAVPAVWTKQSLGDAAATGAVWMSGSNYNVLNVQAPVTSGRGGLWVYNGSSWSRTSGSSWETGWTSAANAYGQTISNVAKAISDAGELWVTASFAWRWDSNAYKKCFTQESGGGGTWSTTALDNVNPAALVVDASLNVWAGFADIGLWKRSSSDGYWTDKNHANTEWSGDATYHMGGNVNSILFDGNNIYVIASPEDQNSTYRLWKSTDGGSTWSRGENGEFSSNHAYMRSLIKESGFYYLTCDGDVWRIATSLDPIENSWTKVLDVAQPLYTLAGSGSRTVLAGGPAGIYRSTNDGESWTETKDLGFDACVGEATAYKENWNGAHSFSFHAVSQTWVCGSYWNFGSCNSPTYGVLRSSDDGQSWSTVTAQRCVRTAYADSCGNRYFFTTGSSFTNGVDNDDEWNRQRGLQVGRYQYGTSGTFYLTDQVYTGSVTGTVTGATDSYRNANANRMVAVTSGGTFYVYLAAQGYGVFMSTEVAGPPDDSECGIERPGGGGMLLRPAVEERPLAVSYANGAFAPSHAGRLQVFDLLGRKVADLEAAPEAGVIPWSGKPGVYYARLRSGHREASTRFVVLPR